MHIVKTIISVSYVQGPLHCRHLLQMSLFFCIIGDDLIEIKLYAFINDLTLALKFDLML